MPEERRTVLLADVHSDLRVALGTRMFAAARNEILPIEYPIILVGDLCHDHPQIFGFSP